MIGILVLGLLIWMGAHFFKRVAPEQRAAMGDKGKGLVTVLLVVSLGLMIWGYRASEFINVWYPPAFMTHINNLLMLVAIFVFGMSATTGRLRGKMRHPQLTAVKIWAVAHLLVNGDLASIILFGGMLAWAVAEVILINKAVPVWDRPQPGEAKKDILLVVITIVVYVVVSLVHLWLGVSPFGG
ncbi:NnrU family protein [Marivita sp. S6314]|uniref:NnrU family protein n=1 Tax=Marivita sp. S6314 TaxID=2926406 RepID=UPI001FF18EC1|nr:NnrU family protein [Marivita sp. S6314]MCK0150559.1 NnrU family protein [Marivita sp. S6314]